MEVRDNKTEKDEVIACKKSADMKRLDNAF